MAAAEKEERRADLAAAIFEDRALLQEAAKRCQARARADHDHRSPRVGGGWNGVPGPRTKPKTCAPSGRLGEVVRGDALVTAPARAGGAFDDRDRDAGDALACQGRRRDRIIARPQRRQHAQEFVER